MKEHFIEFIFSQMCSVRESSTLHSNFHLTEIKSHHAHHAHDSVVITYFKQIIKNPNIQYIHLHLCHENKIKFIHVQPTFFCLLLDMKYNIIIAIIFSLAISLVMSPIKSKYFKKILWQAVHNTWLSLILRFFILSNNPLRGSLGDLRPNIFATI